MLERVHQKHIHKHVLGTWLEESFASGKPRSISDAIRYCSLHIDGFTDKKIRSQRAWVSRAIRSLDLDEYISRSKPSSTSKKPKLMAPSSPSTLEDVEREVSEILVQMQDDTSVASFPASSTESWCPPSVLHFAAMPPHYDNSSGASWSSRPPLPPLYSPHHTTISSDNTDRKHFNPFARSLTDDDHDPTSRW